MIRRFLQWLFPIDVGSEEPAPREPLAKKLRRQLDEESERKKREREDTRWKVLEEHLRWWTEKEIYEKILNNNCGWECFRLFEIPEDHPIRKHPDSSTRDFFSDNRCYWARYEIIKHLANHDVAKPFWALEKEGFKVDFYQKGNARADCAIEVSW